MRFLTSCVLLVCFLAACVDNPDAVIPGAPALSGERAGFTIVLPPDSNAGVLLAADDLAEASAAIGGGAPPPIVESERSVTTAVVVAVTLVEDEELGDQGYRLDVGPVAGKYGIAVKAATHTGAMYGLYEIAADLGVRYHHPEETFFPSASDARLPWDYDGTPQTPHFELRGFHEHTQHPIPMSDYYLRPEPEFRPYVSNYLKWLARNRQNVASWHMLKTVELDEWEPYIADIIDEAHGYGIEIGMVTSLVDEQQNNYKILSDPTLEDDEQIRLRLTRFHELGFDFFTLPIGSSEFTKPSEDDLLRWLDIAANVARGLEPSPDLFTWIHISCDLLADDGSIYWHLPGDATEEIGAWVHTVMFHDLRHPAPVYGCENFQHQNDFIDQEENERELVYFPETAWWLGFDNNAPIGLPITGWTRAWDIQEELRGKNIRGHVTFTSGREWTYWQYDHFLTQITWDDEIGWPEYLEWIAPMYGERASSAIEMLNGWTELQRQNFFEDNPLVYFYVSGELRQDEVGAQAGVYARRPKRSYREVIGYDTQEFTDWKRDEFDLLSRMLSDHTELLETLEVPNIPDGDDLTDVLYFELYSALDVYVKRIAHAIALYEGVIEVREWVLAREAGAEVDGADYNAQLQASRAQLEVAESITGQARAAIEALAPFYRYPHDILIEDKPESLTSYPFGYLEQAHTAHFWTRRDDQLANLIDSTFFERPDEWENEPDVLYFAEGDGISLTEPDNAIAASAIAEFIPRMLFGLSGTIEMDADDVRLTIGQDFNENFIPDPDTEETFDDVGTAGTTWTASSDVYTFIARNDVGEAIGDGLSVFDPQFALQLSEGADGLVLETGSMAGNVASQNLVNLIVDVGGIDAAGVENLLKAIFEIPREDELPALLPFEFQFQFEPAP